MLPVFEQPDGRILRAGFTTGTCAAAAARAATLLLFNPGLQLTQVEVALPAGFSLTLPLKAAGRGEGYACAAVQKEAGDDPDITGRVTVEATARRVAGGIRLTAGAGIGRVTRPGLAVPPGEPAINPGPRDQILRAVSSALPAGRGVEITLSIPGGEELAARTLNPELGIVGGLSVLGTSGVVEPMSVTAFWRSLIPQLDVAIASGHRRVVLVPGKMGRRNALNLLPVAPEAVIVTGNFIGQLLQACVAKGINEAILCGHIGKLVKVAGGIADTHSSVADARREILVAHAALAGLPAAVLRELMGHNTAEESAVFLQNRGWDNVLVSVAEAAAAKAQAMTKGRLRTGCLLLNLQGHVLAADTVAAGLLSGGG
jgi:cobalt-precorrin-5B (C1)-methyltransferase